MRYLHPGVEQPSNQDNRGEYAIEIVDDVIRVDQIEHPEKDGSQRCRHPFEIFGHAARLAFEIELDQPPQPAYNIVDKDQTGQYGLKRCTLLQCIKEQKRGHHDKGDEVRKRIQLYAKLTREIETSGDFPVEYIECTGDPGQYDRHSEISLLYEIDRNDAKRDIGKRDDICQIETVISL